MWDLQDCEGKLREIVTKAVCAQGKKVCSKTYLLDVGNVPDKILGCWVANNRFSAKAFSNCVVVKGEMDVTVWYAYDNNTKNELFKETVTYSEQVPLSGTEGRMERDEEVRVEEAIEPACVAVEIKNGNVELQVEFGYAVEIIGETRMAVIAYLPPSEAECFVDSKEDELEVLDDNEEETNA